VLFVFLKVGRIAEKIYIYINKYIDKFIDIVYTVYRISQYKGEEL